jgi:hypothetical protein
VVVRRRARVVRIRPAGNTGHLLATRRRAGTAERLTDAARAAESWSQANQMFSFITLLGSDYDVWAFSLNDRKENRVQFQRSPRRFPRSRRPR